MQGKLIVLSGPSGSGKTTIAHELMTLLSCLEFSVSATTRLARPGEQDGRDYYFLAKPEFLRQVQEGDFVEWEELFGNYYGTLRSEIGGKRNKGKHLVFDVDVKGALSIKRQYPEALLIFVHPPSVEALRQRLRDRHTEDESALKLRTDRVAMELKARHKFDCQVANDSLEQAVAEVYDFVKHHTYTSGEEYNRCR
ncbi:MAG: guanylate kinase [Bacteroidetes bacterium]|nr:guanylate kinase [Bacteroidota bacterium]